MVIELSIGGLVTLLGIPTAITAFCSWMLQRRITKRDRKSTRLNSSHIH